VSASVNLPLHHKVQKFSSGTGSPGWSRKKGREMVVVVVVTPVMVMTTNIYCRCIHYVNIASATRTVMYPCNSFLGITVIDS